MNIDEIRERLKQDKIDYMLAQWVDLNGTPRCKGVPASARSMSFLAGSAGFAGAATVGMGQGPHSPRHDRHARTSTAIPVVPWEEGVVRFACDIQVDGREWPYCAAPCFGGRWPTCAPRGYMMMAGVEAEHILVSARPTAPSSPSIPAGSTPDKPCYDFKGLSANMPYLRTLIRYMEEIGWEPYASDHEDGIAQFELNWRYADAVTTADRYTFFKMMTSQVAGRYGAIATHMPKPFRSSDRKRRPLAPVALGRGREENVFLDTGDPRGFGPVPAGLPFSRRS